MGGNKGRKDTYTEEVEELDVPNEKSREVKSVIKEAPEKGNNYFCNYVSAN